MTARQFYIMFAIYLISIKIQKLPVLISQTMGKDTYLVFLLYALLNMLGIVLMFAFLKYIRKKEDGKINVFLKVLKKILMLATCFYFIIRSLLLYENIQDLFANALFDNLSWALFSLLLLFSVFYVANIGIKNIALNFEIYFPVIFISFILIMFLGGSYSDFSYVLPLQNTNVLGAIKEMFKYNLWFGDFFVMYYLGKNTKDIKLSKTLLVYGLTMLFVIVLVFEFTGIYKAYSATQVGLISVLSERAMLGINVGRADWFLILVTEIGAILGCATSLYFATKCLSNVFVGVRPVYLETIIAGVIYYFDVFVLVDIEKKINFFLKFASFYSAGIKAITLLALLIVFFKDYYRLHKKDKTLQIKVGRENCQKVKYEKAI